MSISCEIILWWMQQDLSSLVNIGSGNGLELSDNKLLLKTMLNKIPDAIWHY